MFKIAKSIYIYMLKLKNIMMKIYSFIYYVLQKEIYIL